MSSSSAAPRRDDAPSRRERLAAKQQVLTRAAPSSTSSIADAVVIKHNDIFLLTTPNGCVPGEDNHGFGLFHRDCRFLSRYDLRFGDQWPQALGANASHGFATVLALTNPDLAVEQGTIPKETIAVTWERVLDGRTATLYDRLTFHNHWSRPVRLPVTFAFGARMEDVYIVRGLLDDPDGRPVHVQRWHEGLLRAWSRGQDERVRGVAIRMTPAPAAASNLEARYSLDIPPAGQASIGVTITLSEGDTTDQLCAPPERPDIELAKRDLVHAVRPLLDRYARIQSDSRTLNEMVLQSLRDIDLLRTRIAGEEFVAAGAPWFVTLFGRDSILTAYELLAFDHRVAAETLRLLARYQGRRVDEWRNEEPGKILHELRVGPLAQAGMIPHTPYYGTVDATPLFVILLAEHAAWTGDLALARELAPAMDAALRWLDEYADADHDGFLDYDSPAGDVLINQGWKDSGDAMVRADGTIPRPPIAPLEAQAYACRAWRGAAMLARRMGDAARADELDRKARVMQERIEAAYWLDDVGLYAMALEQGGVALRVAASNAGHALWCGVASNKRAAACAERLCADDLFTGWGLRTLSSRERRYNPLGYHLGGVWPHDTAIAAAGLKRYGHCEAAGRLAGGVLDAAFELSGHRMPELLAGFQRGEYRVPLKYPVANHPQAWGAASIPFLLTVLLGLEPDGFARRLTVRHPDLPAFVDRLELHGVDVANAQVDLRFARGDHGIEVETLAVRGTLAVEVVR